MNPLSAQRADTRPIHLPPLTTEGRFRFRALTTGVLALAVTIVAIVGIGVM